MTVKTYKHHLKEQNNCLQCHLRYLHQAEKEMHGRKKHFVKISTLEKYTSININKAVTKYFYYRNEALLIQRNVQRMFYCLEFHCDVTAKL